MSKLTLEAIGNIDPDYKPRIRFTTPLPPTYVRDTAAVKFYKMVPYRLDPNEPDLVSKQDITEARKFLTERLRQREIDPKTGLGFAIVSEDVLSLTMWGGDFPSLANPTIFTYGPRPLTRNSLKKAEIETAGAYCAWEAQDILAYEAKAWINYMNDSNSTSDPESKEAHKQAYLDTRFSGLSGDWRTSPDRLDVRLSHIKEFRARAQKRFQRLGIMTLGGLTKATSDQLYDPNMPYMFKNFGEGSLAEVNQTLKELGLNLNTGEPFPLEELNETPLGKRLREAHSPEC